MDNLEKPEFYGEGCKSEDSLDGFHCCHWTEAGAPCCYCAPSYERIKQYAEESEERRKRIVTLEAALRQIIIRCELSSSHPVLIEIAKKALED